MIGMLYMVELHSYGNEFTRVNMSSTGDELQLKIPGEMERAESHKG